MKLELVTNRRRFLQQVAALPVLQKLVSVAAPADLGLTASNTTGANITTKPKTMKLGFHTDAFNSAYWSFEKCLQWAQQNQVHYIECGLIDGVSWIHGLGYQPHVALYEDPVLLRKNMDQYGVQFSQVR